MLNYIRRFKLMVQELQQRTEFMITQFTINPPLELDRLKALGSKIRLTDSMIEFYTQADGLTLKWRGIETFQACSGSINLLPLSRVFNLFANKAADSSDKGFYFPFETPSGTSWGAFTGSGQSGKITLGQSLYYHNSSCGTNNLEIEFDQYLEFLLKTRGFLHWQTTLEAAKHGKEVHPSSKAFRKMMPLLFSDYNYRDFYANNAIYQELIHLSKKEESSCCHST